MGTTKCVECLVIGLGKLRVLDVENRTYFKGAGPDGKYLRVSLKTKLPVRGVLIARGGVPMEGTTDILVFPD